MIRRDTPSDIAGSRAPIGSDEVVLATSEVALDTVLEPYDYKLKGAGRVERSQWSNEVLAAKETELGPVCGFLARSGELFLVTFHSRGESDGVTSSFLAEIVTRL